MRFIRVVCRGCGTVYDRRELTTTPGAAGCLVGLVIGVGAGVIAGLWARRASVGLAVGWMILTALSLVARLLLHLRYGERARLLARPVGCPRCGGRAAQRPSS